MDQDRKITELNLTPQLDYARPGPRRPWLDIADDLLHLIGGWLGLIILVGVYLMLLAPWAGMLAAVPLLIGAMLLQAAVFYWIHKG